MRNSSVTDPGDKIAFLRSNLQPGSLASTIMQASVFIVPINKNDYDDFVAKFYASFDDMGDSNIVLGVNHLVESISKHLASQSYFVAQVGARRFATDITRYLKEAGWGGDTSLTYDQLEKFNEFLAYMLFVEPTCRNASLSLTYKKDEDLFTFVKKIKSKLLEHKRTPASSAAVSAVLTRDGINPQSSSQTSTKGASSKFCHFCKRPGHAVAQCRRRGAKRDDKATAAPKDTGTKPKTPPPAAPATPPRNPNPSPSAGAQRRWCVVHHTASHNTDDCFLVSRLSIANRPNNKGTSSQSGEVSRGATTDTG